MLCLSVCEGGHQAAVGFSKHYNTILSTILLMYSVYMKITYKPCILMLMWLAKRVKLSIFVSPLVRVFHTFWVITFVNVYTVHVFVYIIRPNYNCTALVNSGSAIYVVFGAFCKHSCFSSTHVDTLSLIRTRKYDKQTLCQFCKCIPAVVFI